jgi:hypothetical protein
VKRILNLNHQGMLFIGLIVLFGVVIPGIMWLLRRFIHGSTVLLIRLMHASLILAGLLLAVFLLLLIIEQVQDYLLYRAYRKGLGKRIPLADGLAECPYCGCRQVHEYQSACPVCGKELASQK